jgi:hypothetical protein
MADPAVVLLDPLMICSEPERLTGILFQRAELEQCLKPSVMTSATKITSALGSNVLLRCDATGYPTPQLMWTRSDSLQVNYTGIFFIQPYETRNLQLNLMFLCNVFSLVCVVSGIKPRASRTLGKALYHLSRAPSPFVLFCF